MDANLSNEEARLETSSIHPILIPHVVERVMEYLPREGQDLRRCRLVCKQWASSASVVLRAHSEIRIGRYCTDVSRLAQLLEIAQSSDFIPLSKFVFCQDVFNQENEEILKKFFQVFSQTIESLVLWFDLKSTMQFDHCSFVSSPEFQNLQLPRLKFLGFDDRRVIGHNFEHTGPLFIRWLLKASPNIEELIVQYDREFESNGFEKAGYVNLMLMQLFTENQNSLRHLKDLKFDVHINDTLLNCLNIFCQTSRLTSLHLCLRRSSFHKESFSTLLSTLSHSLQELRVTFLSKESEFNIQFPRMEALELLEVSGWDGEFPNVYFSNFSYSTHLPRLKTLLINSWTCKPDWWQFLRCKNPILTIEELKIPERITTVDCMKDYVKIFPNLRKLELHISVLEIKVLELVFEHLTELTHLKIIKSTTYWERSDQVIDSVFTGISQEGCATILKSKCLDSLLPNIEDLKNHLKTLRQKPGLTNLKKLRRFELKDLQYLAQITDVTGYLAFMCMENLEYLDAGRSSMSQECIKKLAIKYPRNMVKQSKVPKLSSKQDVSDLEASDECLVDLSEIPGRCNFL